MCGIAGFSLVPGEGINARRLAHSLLLSIEERGTHATGAAWHNPIENRVHVAKKAMRATAFAQTGRLARMDPDTVTAILHTRFATKGSPANPANNHPIVSGRIIGVHNGHLANDDELFSRYPGERRGQVDSEAAFAVLDRTVLAPEQVLDRLQGRAALAWIDRRKPSTLNMARVTDSPLAVGQTPGGSTIFASTERLLRRAAVAAGIELEWAEEMPEWVHLTARHGVIGQFATITGKAAA